MTKIIQVLSLMAILLLSVTVTSNLVDTSFAVKSKGTPNSVTGSDKVCGDRLCSEVQKESKTETKKKEEIKSEKKAQEKIKAEAAKSEIQKDPTESHEEEAKEYAEKRLQEPVWKTISRTITSDTDPGKGHEMHQLAILLPPGKTIYKGHLTYSASENVQLVSLHGPLKKGEDKGQLFWTLDGMTKYGLTLVDQKSDSGIWTFSGKALAIHSMNSEPFTVTYSVTYKEMIPSKKIYSESMTSMSSPALGHEGHNIAMILPPSDEFYRGRVTFVASEPVQFVSLTGPLGPGDNKGQPTWTMDGKTKYGFTFIKADKTSGTWEFSGNGIAFHSMNKKPFTISYTVTLESIPK
ncbi:hypothetical protein [Nitrosopumilus ureiphilus]|uniref:Uncharacterized protein n=1 Tax=Nitrosopumilus ureiphilus TaxID=1470067 RepID=A0A7D5M4T6_9ARCH|nr:hypothetical protein [Nitrosopumilus ureiphilus]QLH07254.1 hypothetical protein C5F50_09310 [Nitrosopumilus ureiphilus]